MIISNWSRKDEFIGVRKNGWQYFNDNVPLGSKERRLLIVVAMKKKERMMREREIHRYDVAKKQKRSIARKRRAINYET